MRKDERLSQPLSYPINTWLVKGTGTWSCSFTSI